MMRQGKISLTILGFVCALTSGCMHRIQIINVPSNQIFSYKLAKQAESDGIIQSTIESINSLNTVAFKIEKGETIPLHLELKTSYLDLVEANNTMLAKKDFYILVDKQRGMFVSANANEWAYISDADAVKKVLDIKVVDFYFNVGFDNDGSKALIHITEKNILQKTE